MSLADLPSRQRGIDASWSRSRSCSDGLHRNVACSQGVYCTVPQLCYPSTALAEAINFTIQVKENPTRHRIPPPVVYSLQ